MKKTMINNQTGHLVKPLLVGSLFMSSAILAQASVFDFTAGHGHFGLNYDVNPKDPRDRRDNTSSRPKLNPGGGLFPHVAALDNPPNNLFTDVAPGPYGPDQVTHIVPNTTFQARAASADLDDALGNGGGDFMWILPEDSTVAANQGAPWTGFAVNGDALSDDFDGNSVNVSLTAVSGPGEVALWASGAGLGSPPDVWMGSADGFSNDTRVLNASHPKHNFMGFTEQGDYDVTFKWDAVVSGSPISESATFGFSVVPEPASYGLLAGVFAAALLLLRGRRN